MKKIYYKIIFIISSIILWYFIIGFYCMSIYAFTMLFSQNMRINASVSIESAIIIMLLCLGIGTLFLYVWKELLKKYQLNFPNNIENINDLKQTIDKLTIENKDLRKKLSQENSISQKKTIVEEEISKLLMEKNTLKNEIAQLNKELLIDTVNIEDFENISSQEIKNKLQMLQLSENELISNNKAILVHNSNINKKTLSSNVKQILRCFNSETKSIIDNLTIKNIDSSRAKIQKSYNTLNSIYQTDFVSISADFYEMKLKEITIIYEYLEKLEEEKEQQKIIREKLVEEEKLRKEIEKEKQRIEKEEIQFKNEITKLMKYLSSTSNDVEKQLYIDKIRELEDKIKLLEKDKENVLSREQNTRAGYVYIISNIGSFGENIYKIGMTRRLEPMDRIKELSDASVPFQFDVHALIFSDDAPALENILHQTFKDNQVNKLNPKKEFYNIDLEKIKEVVKNNYNNTVNFIDYPEAYEYRESQKLLEVSSNEKI